MSDTCPALLAGEASLPGHRPLTNPDPFQTGSVITLQIAEVVQWTKPGASGRLFLPPIQRSMVWRNSQIINYWDSLLRGYPAGLMMVHRPREGALQARTSDGNTREIRAEDFQLFDGQQRLTAILLGLGEGQLKDRLKLWVDLGNNPPAASDLQFLLRMSSTGQPFGYEPVAPNEKPALYKRREKAAEWTKRKGLDGFQSAQAFAQAAGNDLIDVACAVPLQEIAGLVQQVEEATAITALQARYPALPTDPLQNFVQALARALKTPILFQRIDGAIIEKEDEYIRFFGRLGQGGTPLTNDELTYSIIKHHFPEVHDRIKEITEGAAPEKLQPRSLEETHP